MYDFVIVFSTAFLKGNNEIPWKFRKIWTDVSAD